MNKLIEDTTTSTENNRQRFTKRREVLQYFRNEVCIHKKSIFLKNPFCPYKIIDLRCKTFVTSKKLLIQLHKM